MGHLADMPAIWGLAGAFIYAGPKFSACYFNARQTKGSWALCLIDALIALGIGAVSAAALAPWLQSFLGRDGIHELRAMATVIGLLANPAAPGVTEALSGKLIKRLKDEQ